MKEAKQMNISGKVQGVGFRYFAQMAAMECGITGWAHNLDNGSVAIHAEGTSEDIKKYKEALQKGNVFAKVHTIDEKRAEPEHFTSFRIKY